MKASVPPSFGKDHWGRMQFDAADVWGSFAVKVTENCRASSSKHSYSAVNVIIYLVRNSTQLAPILDLCAVYLCLWLSFQHGRNDSGRVDRGRWMLTADHLAFLWISFETTLVFILWFMLRNSLSGNLYAIFIPRFAVIKYRNTIECHGEFGSLSVTNAVVAVSNGIHQTAASSYLRPSVSIQQERISFELMIAAAAPRVCPLCLRD